MNAKARSVGLLAALVLLPGLVFANTGIPILARTVTGIVLWFVPIVIVEILILKKQIGTSAKNVAWPVTVANIVSTLMGIGLEILVIVVDVPLLSDHVPFGTITYLLSLVLFIPLFFLSVAIELPVVRKMTNSVDGPSLKRAIILANAGSYLMMSAYLIARMIKHAVVSGTWSV